MKTILNYINESLDDWEWNDEANKDGKIEVTTSIDDDYNEVSQGTLGRICIELPMPPAFMVTLYGNIIMKVIVLEIKIQF